MRRFLAATAVAAVLSCASGANAQDIDTRAHCMLLRSHADATVNRGGRDWRVNRHRVERGENLRG